MLNRPTAQAESQDLNRDIEVKATRRKWNPALHPRDSKGRFIETGGTVRLWGGKLARVVRALPHDRILVQDQSGPGEFRGRRHTTSAKWVSMVARPDGSAPTDDEDKVAEEDERRKKDGRRGNGVVHDDDGDPDTPNDPHDKDDKGRPIGDDDGDGPDDDDDEDEPEDGAHPVNVDALPNQDHAAGARHRDTAAVRRHFTQLAEQPGTSHDMATFLRSVAYDDDLQTTPSGRLAILRDERNGRFYLTATGTGQRVDAAGDFDTAQDAARFAEHLDKTAVNGRLTQFNQPFDFSDPQLDQAARDWRSTKGENIQGAIQRARREFDGTTPAAPKPADAPAQEGRRFTTVQDVRAHWTSMRDRLSQGGPGTQNAVRILDTLINDDRLKLVGQGQLVTRRDEDGNWRLVGTGSGYTLHPSFDTQQDAQRFARLLATTDIKGEDGQPLDLSRPTAITKWRSDDNMSIREVVDQVLGEWKKENGEAAPAQQTAPEPDAAAQPQPEQPETPQAPALPDDADPVDGVDGYHYVNDGGSITLYGPDGQVAATSERGYPPKAKIDGVTVPIPQYPVQGAAVMARLHRAAQNPNTRDRITAAWVMKPGKNGGPAKRVMVFRGTIKGDQRDYDAVGSTRAIKWSPSMGPVGAYATQSNMTEATRDERISEVLGKLARQGRNIHVTDETAAGSPNAPAAAVDETEALRNAITNADDARLNQMKQERWAKYSRTRSEANRRRLNSEITMINEEQKRRRKERDEAAARDATSLSDDDIESRIKESQQERGTYGTRRGEPANDVERAIYSERRRRSQALLDDDTDLSTAADEDLAKDRETFADRARMHQAAGDDAEAERTMRQALQNRHDAIVGEQQRRYSQKIADRPSVVDLSDEELSDEYHDLMRRDLRKAPPEAQQVLEGRLQDVKRERREREKRAITDREAPENLSDDDLKAEYTELRRARSSYNETDDVKAARKERMAVLEAEQNRRTSTPEDDQLVARVDNPDDNGQLRIDGRGGYGYVDYRANEYSTGNQRREIGWTWSRNSWDNGGPAFPSRAAALAAMVRAYDNDPDTRGERTWGTTRRVFVPKMFVELYQSERRADNIASASQERQYLYSLFRDRYGWDDGVNPLVPSGKKGHNIKGRNLQVPEGLLAELHRVTEELSREMSIRATDRDADSSDRQKAKTRLASINVALHGIEAMREAVRNNGGNDDQKVISREEIEAQKAALRAALGGDDDEHVQSDGPGSLDDAPAAGVGGDGRSGGVREGEGPGDRDADSGGRGGAGEDRSGADGVRGAGRPDQADQGGRGGDGPGGASARAGARDGEGARADADGEAPAGDQGPDVRRVARFRPDPADAPKGARARAVANVEAIRVLKKLQAENRPATDEERRVLARWSGWGSVPILFANEPNEKEPRYQQGGTRYGKFERDHERWSEYSDIRSELQRVLTPVEFAQARRGVLSMHYTPQPIAEAMWDGLRAFGFERGDVLEAGSGAGTFFGVAPDGARLTGVELDPTTARIAQAIYPHANVLNESFAETDARPGTFDAAIGNVPFARVPFDDKRYPAESLHNGFVTKEIALVRPGGITAVITSRQTLDSKGDKARRQMAKYGDLVGAIRLPSGVFNDAGTGVTTDVLVFRRREDGTEPADTSWLDAPEREINGTTHHINAYFDEHPEHILGTLTTQSGPYGPEVTVKGDPAKAAEQLRAALEDIAAKAKADGRGYEPHPDGDDRPPVQLQTAREKHANDWTGRLYEGDDGQFYQHVNGAEPVLLEPADGNTAQLRALMQLRDVAAELRELDRKNDEEERAENLRAQLRDLHAAYVEKYGPLSKPGQHRTKGGRPTAWGYFRADPDAAAVLALERWDADKGEPVLSRVFSERAAARRQPLSSTDDPKAALAAVVAAKGEVDLGEVARLLDVDPQEALQRLGNEVFTDPQSGRLELASAYLSGAVRDKLDAARKAAEKDPAFAVNVAALEAVQPPERTIGQFTPEMGAHWTPPELLQGFLRDYLGDRTLRVAHDDRYGWILNTGRVPEANNLMYGVPADPEKGTKGKNAVEIARAILGFGSLTVYEDDKRKEVDEATSRLIRQKADQMRAEFAKYATANAERLSVLTESYNRIMNGHIVRSYEGMSPTLEGFTPDRNPHAWQRSGAARMQFERGVILAHEVGLGKTSTLVMGTQALKASGQIEKPMAVVPNHLAKQWADEARFLYPNADIHLITSGDLAGDRRASTLEWLRANKPDLVIFTEEAFGSIKMSPEAQEEYEFRELEALREQLDRQYEDADNPNHPFIVAKIEQRIATVQKNINKNAAPMRRPGETYWDDLGFDYFVVDEAHRYKGVGFRSKEAGGDPASIRGVDLHQKTTDLHRRRQGRATITLATGTPLSNSISEQFTMLQFAAPWVLDAYKAGAPDLWANTFGRKTLRIENAPDGSGLRVVERFSEFHNKRAMKTMWGLVADTKRADDVGIPRPKVKGGAPNLIMVDATPDQKKRLKGLVARGRAIHNGEVDRHEDNMLAVSNEGTSVALDPRLIDANAPAGNKLKAVADRHIERYHANKDRVYKVAYGSDEDHPVPGALQMIFLNEGVPGGKNKGNFDAYAELKRLMVAGGIPEDKIAFVQDAKKSGKPEDMTELFRKAREGEISVLIGSSAVAGTGMNAQDRMISLSHVDLDWGAAQMEQRNGRVLRYGNMNPEVEIDIYATKGSMDGWKAGFVATKAEGLVDIQRPEPEDGDSSDVVQEIDGAEFDYETMEAEIGGNPYMSQLMKARRRLKDLEIDQHNEAAERIRRAEALEALRQEARVTRDGIERREQALPRIQPAGDQFRMTLAGSPYAERADAGKLLHREITARLLDHDREGMGPFQKLGEFRGLEFGVRTERDADGKLIAHVGFPDLLHSEFTRTIEDLKKKGAGSGMITRLSNALDKAPALQESERAKVPELDEQIALLQSAHAATDLTPQIDHARKRSHLLEEIVARITDLDAKPEIDPDELDKKRYKKHDREMMAKERREEREPLQAAVDRAVAELDRWDRENPAPEDDDTVRLSEEEVRAALARISPEPSTAPESRDRESTGSDSDGGEPPANADADAPATGGDQAEDDTVRLSTDEVNDTLASIQPAAAAPAVDEPEAPAAEDPDETLQFAWDKPEDFVTLTMPAALVDFLYVDETVAMEDPDTRKALTEAKRGPRGTLKVTGPIEVHQQLLRWAWMLEGGEGLESDPVEMRAYRTYRKRIEDADADLQRRRAEREAADAADSEETDAPETGGTNDGGSNEPPTDAPSTAEPDDGDDDQDQDAPAEGDTVTLSPDEVSDQLDAVRPEGSKAPSTMDDGEIRDEIVDLMGREMAGELSGADRTRLQVLEAEEARRAGRAPKPEPKPKRTTDEPGGLFDVDQPTTQQPTSAADVDNPEDRPDDLFGTPDMIADAEGRSTEGLRPAQMRNAADLEVGDRYTDADGRTHTVAEAPVKTPRGRTRLVTDDGQERFYNGDAQVRLRYPDEEIPENDTEEQNQSEPADTEDETPAAPELPDDFADVRQRYDGEMVPASEINLDDWVHVATADPVYNEPMHMVGRVINITPVLSNGQRRIEVETHLKLNGKDTVRTEFAMIRATDLVERLPEGNPGREDSSDLTHRIEGERDRHHASKVPVPEGWQAADGSQIQPRPGDRFRIVARRGGGSGPNGGREHMNVTVEGPADQDGRWRVRNQPITFGLRDIVAVPDDADERRGDDNEPDTISPDLDGPDSTADVDEPDTTTGDRDSTRDRVDRMSGLIDEATDGAGGDELPEVNEARDAIGRAENSDDPDAELRSAADRLDSLAEMYELGGPDGERAAELFRRAARIARGDDDRDNDRHDDDRDRNEDDSDTTVTPAQDSEEDQDDDERRRQRRDGDADGGAADPDGTPNGGGTGAPGAPSDDEDNSDSPDDAPSNADDEQDGPEAGREQDNDRQRRRRRRRRDGGGGGNGGPGGPGLPHLNLPDLDSPNTSGDDEAAGRGNGTGGRGRSTPARHRDIDSLRRAWKNGDGLTPAEDTPERRVALAQAADRDGLTLSPGGGLVTWPERQDDGTTLWHFAQARNGSNLPGLTLATDDPEEARALAGRFEEITGRDGEPFDWHRPWGPSTIAQWRDGEGRNLQRALHAVRDDFEQQRAAASPETDAETGRAPLPDDLTTLDDDALLAAWSNDLSDDDQTRLMEEMDRRDGYTDQRVRSILPDTPPADAAEAERRAKAVDEALGFGGTDVPRVRRTQEDIIRAAFADFDEARYQRAVEATNGYFYNRKHKYGDNRPDERSLFSGGELAKFGRWREYASEELINWYDDNGGRITYNQFRLRYRENDRIERQQYEEEQRRLAEADAANSADLSDIASPPPGTLPESEEDAAQRFGGADRMRALADRADLLETSDGVADVRLDGRVIGHIRAGRRSGDGDHQSWDAAPLLSIDRDHHSRSSSRDTAVANLVVHALRNPVDDQNPDQDTWDTVKVHLANRNPELPDLPDHLSSDPAVKERYERLVDFVEGLRAQQVQNGSMKRDLEHARTEFQWLHGTLAGGQGKRRQDRETLKDLERRAFWATRLLDGFGDDDRDEQPRAADEANAPTSPDDVPALRGAAQQTPAPDAEGAPGGASDRVDGPDNTQPSGRDGGGEERGRAGSAAASDSTGGDGTGLAESSGDDPSAQRAARPSRQPQQRGRQAPEPSTDPAAGPETRPEPEPVGGQPAHWARVRDLVPGDMVRMEGRTKRGRATTRSGYVFTAPVDVEVTRNGRTERMLRTYVTERPDGTGRRGNVFTPLNATAARAEAPDDVVPGFPTSGAQSTVQTGNLPDVIPADREGRGLFPGSTVRGVDGLQTREGTVISATHNTVSVRWDNDDTADGLSPTTLTVTGGDRPDGWTPNGQRVTTRHIVTDADGSLLGPVDEVDGDRVTITTAEGRITRSAGDLRVTGEVRDDAPDTDPVTGIDEPTAADLKEDDVVVLDLDGTLTTVAVTGIDRDGDRVTIDFADTTTGEIGQIDMDAATVLPRAQGANGTRPDLGPDDAPDAPDDLTVHQPPARIEPVTGPTVDPTLTAGDRDVIGDLADGPDDDPDAQQAAVRITNDLPVTPEQAAALAAQLRDSADPSTPEGRAALRAADHLDRAADRTPPAGLDRPRPSNAAHVGEGDLVAMPDERHGDQVRVFRVIDAEDGPGGVRSFLLEDEDQQWRRRIVHGAMPVWQLPDPAPEPLTPPDDNDTTPEAPNTPRTPDTPSLPVARVRPGNLRVGDVIDAPVSRTGYQFNGHRRLTIISEPHRNGWWMQLTGIDDDGNVHDFGLHSGRDVNVYERNRPTPALPPSGAPRDPNPAPQSAADRIVAGHPRTVAARIIDEAIAGTEPPGDIHALREQIAQRLTAEALRDARQAARQDARAALDAAGITGRDRAAALQALKRARQEAHTATVRAALRTINDLEPLPDESDEDLAARARDLLSLIPDQIGGTPDGPDTDGDADVARAVAGHVDDAVNALLQQLQADGVDPGDADRIARILTQQMDGARHATARQIARRVSAVSPQAGRQPGLLARIVAALIRLAKRFAELVRIAGRKIAEKYRGARDRLRRLRAFIGRLARRVRQWPEARRLARLHRALDLPGADGDSLTARISHWAGLLPEPGRFGQAQRRVTWWKPTTWAQLAAGRLPGRRDRIQWAPDRAEDGGPGLTALRHLAALRAAGGDVDQDVTRRLAAALGDDFGDDPHGTLQRADDFVALTERRLVNLQAARTSGTLPDDPDLEVEITAARAEASAARREWADLRARYAAAVPDAVASALAEIRDMGPEGNAGIVFGPDTTPDAERAVRGVQRLIPRTWLNAPAARRVTAVDGDEGRYEPDAQRITVADLADDGLGTAGHALAQHLARHLDDLDAAQRAFWFSQTHTGRPGARRMRRSTLSRILRRQQTQPDTGDTLARSVQSMFNGDWYLDDDLRAFLLGLLATR
ncbi:SNF2-related protein [Streptomyces pseudogriseolus]|uniref:SNF2-related protein n=1 Tax=Streptomyces pseudogriseolus TaxID=36817 RepID=UPI003FA25B59